MTDPQAEELVSIVVRSYKRPGPLLELLERLRRQDYRHFEIVLVEQTDDPDLVQALGGLGEPRLRILVRPPLGPAGARNEGIRHARAEILLFIDDDDLPLGDDWVRSHVENYEDPLCMGVTGRLCSSLEPPPEPRFPRFVRWASFRYSPFKDPRTLPFGSLRKEGIPFLVGNNFSVRRSLVDRAGGWDEGIPMGEELSFCFRADRVRKPGEYLAFDPRPVVFRRLDVPGGLDRRVRPDWHENELKGRVIYYHHVVRHYFPLRFWALYPLFVLRSAERTIVWIWDGDNRARGLAERLRCSIAVLGRLPHATLEWGFRYGDGDVRRVPRLEPGAAEGDATRPHSR